MDDIVKKAMAKWPNVPDCFGWLGLDARGNWYMRDDKAQSVGSFSSGLPGAKGAMLKHDKLIEFIQRNYGADAQGRWYFQNGPQRVFVELECTPHVWRVDASFGVHSHTGARAHDILGCLCDELGRVYLWAELSQANVLGLVHTQDVWQVARALEQEVWQCADTASAELEARYGYIKSPATQQALAASLSTVR